jgi:hypothetical protein
LPRVVAVDLQGAIVRASGEPRIDVAEVLVRDRVLRMRLDRELEDGLRALVVALRGVEHREVVVGLGQLGKFLGEAHEDLDRLGGLLLFGQHQSSQETSLGILRLALDVHVHLVERRGQLSLAVELLGLLEVVGGRGRHASREERERGQKDAIIH